jgi:hypothetical protein
MGRSDSSVIVHVRSLARYRLLPSSPHTTTTTTPRPLPSHRHRRFALGPAPTRRTALLRRRSVRRLSPAVSLCVLPSIRNARADGVRGGSALRHDRGGAAGADVMDMGPVAHPEGSGHRQQRQQKDRTGRRIRMRLSRHRHTRTHPRTHTVACARALLFNAAAVCASSLRVCVRLYASVSASLCVSMRACGPVFVGRCLGFCVR